MKRLIILCSLGALLISSCTNQTETKQETVSEVKQEQKIETVKVAPAFEYEMKTSQEKQKKTIKKIKFKAIELES